MRLVFVFIFLWCQEMGCEDLIIGQWELVSIKASYVPIVDKNQDSFPNLKIAFAQDGSFSFSSLEEDLQWYFLNENSIKIESSDHESDFLFKLVKVNSDTLILSSAILPHESAVYTYVKLK